MPAARTISSPCAEPHAAAKARKASPRSSFRATRRGIHMTRLHKVGNNCMSSWDIGFEDVEVPDDALMGEQGKGMRNMMTTLQYSRTGQAALCIGLAQAAIDGAKAFAIDRRQFDRRIADFQVIRHRLVDMQTRVDQARLMLYHSSWLVEKGQPCRKETAQTKVLATEALEYVSHSRHADPSKLRLFRQRATSSGIGATRGCTRSARAQTSSSAI